MEIAVLFIRKQFLVDISVIILGKLGIQQLSSVIESLGMPVHFWCRMLVRFLVELFNQQAADPTVASLRVHKQIVQVDDLVDIPGRHVVQVGRKPDKRAGFSVLGDETPDGRLCVEKALEGRVCNLFRNGRVVECQVSVPQRNPGFFVGGFNESDSDCHWREMKTGISRL